MNFDKLELFQEYMIQESDFAEIVNANGGDYKFKKRDKNNPLKHIIFLGYSKFKENIIFSFSTTTAVPKLKNKYHRIFLMKTKKDKKIYLNNSQIFELNLNKLKFISKSKKPKYQKHLVFKAITSKKKQFLEKNTVIKLYAPDNNFKNIVNF